MGRESAEGGSKKRESHGGEQVFRKRRDADRMLSEGKEIVAVCRQLERLSEYQARFLLGCEVKRWGLCRRQRC